jgi:hypothetical protein
MPPANGVVVGFKLRLAGARLRYWARVILDEAHLAKRREGSFAHFMSLERYSALHLVTATPTINTVKDISTYLHMFWRLVGVDWELPRDCVGNYAALYQPEYDPECEYAVEGGDGVWGIFSSKLYQDCPIPDATSKLQDIYRQNPTKPERLWLLSPELFKYCATKRSCVCLSYCTPTVNRRRIGVFINFRFTSLGHGTRVSRTP